MKKNSSVASLRRPPGRNQRNEWPEWSEITGRIERNTQPTKPAISSRPSSTVRSARSEILADTAREHQRLQGPDGPHREIQVWSVRRDENVVHIDFLGQKVPYAETQETSDAGLSCLSFG